MANIWQERALRHYDEVNLLIHRIMELEGRAGDTDRFLEILDETEKASEDPKAASAVA